MYLDSLSVATVIVGISDLYVSVVKSTPAAHLTTVCESITAGWYNSLYPSRKLPILVSNRLVSPRNKYRADPASPVVFAIRPPKTEFYLSSPHSISAIFGGYRRSTPATVSTRRPPSSMLASMITGAFPDAHLCVVGNLNRDLRTSVIPPRCPPFSGRRNLRPLHS